MPRRRMVTGRSQDPRKRFVEEMRRLRLERGDSLRKVGEVLGWDWSLFGKMEAGETLGGPETVQALDQHYGTGDLLITLWELASSATGFRERYRQYMSLEAEAVSLWQYAPSVPHGLLQTEDYARTMLALGGLQGEELAQQVSARLTRRDLLDGQDAPRFRAMLSETVLRTPLRDSAQWQKQLEYLLEMADRPNVTLHVVEQAVGPHALTNTDVMFLRSEEPRTVAWVETGYSGDLVEDVAAVEKLQASYDSVRDLALSPAESRVFITRLLEGQQ